MKLTKSQLKQIIKEELESAMLTEQSLELSNQEKKEAEFLLRITGQELKDRMEMVVNMAGGEFYNKIAGAFQANLFGEKGQERAKEMMQIDPDLKPVEGDWQQDRGDEGPEWKSGKYLTEPEMGEIKSLVGLIRNGADTMSLSSEIKNRAPRDRGRYRAYISKLVELFGRLANFGSHLDQTRGIFFGEGGMRQAQDVGYVVRPEDDKKIRLSQLGDLGIAGDELTGTRRWGSELQKALEHVPKDLQESKTRITKSQLKQIIVKEIDLIDPAVLAQPAAALLKAKVES